MGDFRITVNAVGGHGCQRAVGGHGCQREVKDGGTVYGCGSMNCPDCITAQFISDFARAGSSIRDAKIEHWPGQPSAVTDDFDVTSLAHSIRAKRTRTGSF